MVLGRRGAQIVADATLVLKELSGHHRAYRVAALILRPGATAPISVEPGDRVGATRLQLTAEHIAIAHPSSIGARRAPYKDAAGRRSWSRAMSQWPVDPEAFELVLLRRPEQAPERADDVVQRIREDHLAYHARLRESETGQVVTNSPVVGQPDPSLLGLTVYRTGSLEQSRQPAGANPAVRAGRLTVEIMTWCCPPGGQRDRVIS
jgi:hypothetical protein